MLSERLGRWNFWTMFVFFNVTFFPMHISGILGMPRRVYTYPSGLGWDGPNLISSLGAFGFAGGVALFLVNLLWSARRGRVAAADPWGGDTLEWSESSPPPEAQFPRLPVVESRHPLWSRSAVAPEGVAAVGVVAALDHAPSRWRGALLVSVAEARPLAVVHMPGGTIAPFLMAVGFVFVFAAALVEWRSLLVAGALICLTALAVWFWPKASERAALEDGGVGSPAGRLPLAVAGPLANGWWGTVSLIVTLATALTTILASYVYVIDGQLGRVEPGPWRLQALATAAALVASPVAWWITRRPQVAMRRRLGLSAASALLLTFVVLSGVAFSGAPLTPSESAYASLVAVLLGFSWCVAGLTLAMLAAALAWAWGAADDARGVGVALNATLVAHFSAASALIGFVTIYVTPWLG